MQHITGRRHRKFATDDSNFIALDYVLARVKRRTVKEVQAERSSWRPARPFDEELNPEDDSDVKIEPHDDHIADDFQWGDWVAGEDVEVKAEDEP